MGIGRIGEGAWGTLIGIPPLRRAVDSFDGAHYIFSMPSYTSIRDKASFQGRDAELVSMSEEIRKVQVGDRTVAVASYWYSREWLAKTLFPERADGLDSKGLVALADEEGLPARCPGSLWALKQVERERRDIFIDSGLSFSTKIADQVTDLADLDADSVPGAYQVPYLNGPTGSGKTMLVRIYAAAVGKAYFPVLCTGDDELMLTKKLKGKKDLRASVRTEEMKKRAEFGVFETRDSLLAFLRALKKNGAGETLESHQDAYRKISQTDWDFIAESNGFPNDESFSGIYVYGEAELAARMPMGVVVNFDEFGLASGAVQADIRELFFDRSSELTPGVNATFTTTDNPAGEKYFNRTPIAGDNASRLQFRSIPLPGPDELVPDVCRSLGHSVEVAEANKRLLDDPFCNTTPGLEESRPPLLRDSAGMDKDVIPPAKLTATAKGQDAAVTFFKKILGKDAETYFPDAKRDKMLSKLLSREQAVNLSMRLVSLFCRVYKHVNDPTGPLNPKFYNHDSSNAPEFSRRTLRSICAGVENRMRDVLENIKDGGVGNVPEQLALCVHKAVESYVFKQVDFRAAPTGTTVDGDSTRKAARESRPVISQIVKDSGLGWGDLQELFVPVQGGWIEEDATKAFGISGGASKVAEAGLDLANEIKPQDSVLRFKFGSEAIYIPAGGEQVTVDGSTSLDSKLLYKLLDPVSDGLSPEQLAGMFNDYKKSGGFGNGNAIFDAVIQVAEREVGEGGLSGLAQRISEQSGGELDFSAKWCGDIGKTTGGNGVYFLALGGGKALAFDFNPAGSKKAGNSKAAGIVLDGAEEMLTFLSGAVIRGESPGFSVEGTGRTHVSINFIVPSGKPLRICNDGGEFSVSREIPREVGARTVRTGAEHLREEELSESKEQAVEVGVIKPLSTKNLAAGTGKMGGKGRKKQVYRNPGA